MNIKNNTNNMLHNTLDELNMAIEDYTYSLIKWDNIISDIENTIITTEQLAQFYNTPAIDCKLNKLYRKMDKCLYIYNSIENRIKLYNDNINSLKHTLIILNEIEC